MDTRPIGVFDSGVGGLTVVKQIMKVMPHENIVYFGDTARVPYGTKSKEAVTKYSKQLSVQPSSAKGTKSGHAFVTDTFRFVCQKALKHPYEPEIIDIEMY